VESGEVYTLFFRISGCFLTTGNSHLFSFPIEAPVMVLEGIFYRDFDSSFSRSEFHLSPYDVQTGAPFPFGTNFFLPIF